MVRRRLQATVRAVDVATDEMLDAITGTESTIGIDRGEANRFEHLDEIERALAK